VNPEMLLAVASTITAVGGFVTVVGAQVVGFRKLREEIHQKADEQTKIVTRKLDETQVINALQIQASNSFNTKFEKLQQQINLQDHTVRVILKVTGITTEEDQA